MLNNLSKKTKYVAVSGLFVVTTAMAATVITHSQKVAPSNVKSDNPASNFTVKDGEVTNANDGLVWQRCLVGQTFANGACTGTATEFATWADALNYLSTQEKAQGWRVPNIKELMRITDNTRMYPAVDTSLFPFASNFTFKQNDDNAGFFKAGSPSYIWSSTPVGHQTVKERNWNPITKAESKTETEKVMQNADSVYALDLAFGVPQYAYRDGKSRGEHQTTQWAQPDPDHVEKARYLLLVKDAS